MKRTLYVLALGIFGIATTEFGIIGILPKITEAFGVTMEKAGWLLSGFALIIALFAPFMTMLVAKYERKKILLGVLLVFALSNILSAFAGNFTMLLFARILPAFTHPIFWSIALAMAAGSVPAEESPKAVSVVFAGFTIASVLGVPLVTYIAEMLGWRASFLVTAIINGLSFAGLFFFLPSQAIPSLPSLPSLPNAQPELSDRQPAHSPAPRISSLSYSQILRRSILWQSLALACAMIAAMYATYGYLADYLGKVSKMNGSQISGMLLVFGITGVAGNWAAGKAMSRNIGKTTIGFIISLCLVHLLVYCFGPQFIRMTILICLWGFIHTGGYLISNVNVTSTVPEAPEFINSIFTACGNLAVTIGSVSGGLALAHGGVHQVIWISIGLLILSGGLATWKFSRVRKGFR